MAKADPKAPKKDDYVHCSSCEVYVPKSKLVAADDFFEGAGDKKLCPFCGNSIEAAST